MGQARGIYTFAVHLRWVPAILLGYVASIVAHLLINASLFLRRLAILPSRLVRQANKNTPLSLDKGAFSLEAYKSTGGVALKTTRLGGL